MGSTVIPPRQLAPTVGPVAALAGVFIRTGSIVASGERVVCGLVHRFGSLNFLSDNAGCFGSTPFPANGRFINFGDHQVYVATEIACRYPERVHVAADPPAVCAVRGRRITRPANCAEVMMTAPGADAGKGAIGETDAGAKSARTARPPLGRPENRAGYAGPSSVPVRSDPLRDTIEKLGMPVTPCADTVLTQAQLEEQRQSILQEAIEVARVRQEFDISLREYNKAHGFTPVAKGPSCIDDVRNQGKNLVCRLVICRLIGPSIALLLRTLGLQRQLWLSYPVYPVKPVVSSRTG